MPTPHGRRNICTFGYSVMKKTGAGAWMLEIPFTSGQTKELRSRMQSRRAPFDRVSKELQAQRGGSVGLKGAKLIGTTHLADGVDVSAEALTVVLDALRSDGRHEVDLDDINLVVSQLGSRIARLADLDHDTRQHAHQALYSEILGRCTTL